MLTEIIPHHQAAIQKESIDLQALERCMLNQEQVECPLDHIFAEGIYIREIRMPKGAIVLGHEHCTEHMNTILKGSVNLLIGNDEPTRIDAPFTFVSKVGVRKVLEILETCTWQTIHPNPDNLRNIDELEQLLTLPSKTFLNHKS